MTNTGSGHKFPSGFPEGRNAWVALRAFDLATGTELEIADTVWHRTSVGVGYLTTSEPWKLHETARDRAGTILNVALRCVDDLKVMLTPFLPFSSQKLHEYLGYDGVIAPQPEFRTRREPDGSTHDVLTGDYGVAPAWAPTALPAGRKLREPHPLFKKLDPSVVDQEVERMEERGAK